MGSVATAFTPMKAKTGNDIELAMQRLVLTGHILPVGARLIVKHVFKSAERVPVEVIYAFGLPRDAALRRFKLSGAGFSVRSEVKPIAEAAAMYERGIEGGHLSSLVSQYRDGMVNLTVGNVRPGEVVSVSLEILAGVEVQDDGLRFRFPFTLAPCYHPRARTGVTDEGLGELELPEDEFGDLILPKFAEDATGLHEVDFELAVRLPQPACELASPSHPIRTVQRDGRTKVLLAREKDLPNRDLVLDVRTAKPHAGALTGVDREGKGRFVAILPSTSFGAAETEAQRRIVFVLDRSGSMSGAPIEQAKKALQACLGTLSERDMFGIVVFDDKTEVFRKSLVPGTLESRGDAAAFLSRVGARGGTELAAAVSAGARILGQGGGDLLVVTDGQVYSTEKIVAKAQEAGARVHCFGIGSASQDRFLALLARKTGGVSRFLTARERVDLAAVDLFASIGRPVASGVRVTAGGLPDAKIEPEPSEHVFAGAPLVVYGECDKAADGRLRVDWNGGGLELPLTIGEDTVGETLRLLQGARLITDMDSDDELERLSLRFGLASRRAGLVAVVQREGDKPGAVPITRVVPVGMPEDTPFGAYFAPVARKIDMSFMLPSSPPIASALDTGMPLFSRARALFSAPRDFAVDDLAAAGIPEDLLIDEAVRMEPDGGMPGANLEERLAASAILLLRFMALDTTLRSGPFRRHAGRLVGFIEAHAAGLTPEKAALLGRLVAKAREGSEIPGNWERVAPADFWPELEAQLARASI